MVGFNKNVFKPQITVIKDKYYEMFPQQDQVLRLASKGPED